jgi:hypothetical protein
MEKCCSSNTFKLSGNATNELLIQRPWEIAQTASNTSTSTLASPASEPSEACTSATSITNKGKTQQIGIGVGLGIPLLVALGLLFWENRKRRHAEAQLAQHALPTEYMQQPTQEYEDAPVYASEVEDSKYNGAELGASTQIHELEYDERRVASS